MTGFLVVLLASAALEALRFHSTGAGLPLAPGGLLGMELGEAARTYLGFTGGTLVLLALIAGGLSLFTGISWLSATERLGLWLEQAWASAQRTWYAWKDRRAGRELAQKREAVVQTRRAKVEKAPPVITSYSIHYTKLYETCCCAAISSRPVVTRSRRWPSAPARWP